MYAIENFPEVDFRSIKLNLAAATSSLLQTGSDDVNVEDDASTQPPQDEPAVNAPPSQDETLTFVALLFLSFCNFVFGPQFLDLLYVTGIHYTRPWFQDEFLKNTISAFQTNQGFFGRRMSTL